MSISGPEFAAIIGIDWADQQHDICLQVNGAPALEHQVLEQRPEAIEAWANGLRERFGGRRIAVGIELRKGPLINALSKYEHLIRFPVDPAMLSRLPRAFKPSGAKSDPTDAALVVDILLHHRDQLQPWALEDPRTRQLQAFVEQRRRLIDLRVKLTNQLTANLKGYFPQALTCFDCLDSLLACDFLERWSCLAEAKPAKASTLTSFYYKHNVRSSELIDQRLTLLHNALPLTTDAGILLPAVALTKALVAQLRTLLGTLKHHDALIAKAFHAHPDRSIFESLPGAGPVFAPRLLAAIGSDRQRYPSAEALQRYLGIAPVTERSGHSCWVHWRWSCPKFLRQSIIEWAGLSVRYSLWAQTYYECQRAKGKPHQVAIRALAFKWLRILFRCWQDRRPYDEVHYLRSLKQRHSPLITMIAGTHNSAA